MNKFLLLLMIGKVLDKVKWNSKKIWKGSGDVNKKLHLSLEVCAGEKKYLGTDSAGKINRPSDSADQSGQLFVGFDAPLIVVT